MVRYTRSSCLKGRRHGSWFIGSQPMLMEVVLLMYIMSNVEAHAIQLENRKQHTIVDGNQLLKCQQQ
jgi:hypothetical protein